MKKTVLAIGLVLALSLSAAASFEFYGGGSYNTFDPEELNEFIKAINGVLEEWENSGILVEPYSIEVDDLTKAEEIKSGFGAFGGVRYWVNPTMAVGGEIEYFGAKSEASVSVEVEAGDNGGPVEASVEGSISASVTGFSGAGAFKASPELTIFASAGYYYLNGEVGVKVGVKEDGNLSDLITDLEVPKGKSKFTDKGLGFKAGVAFAYPVADELSIVGRAAYRSLKFDEIEFDEDKDDLGFHDAEIDELDFSGLELGLGIVYSF
jgi:opacity protein-like surface antigen